MATITLNYDARNSIAVKTIQYVLSLGIFSTETITPRTTTPTFDTVGLREYRAGNYTIINNGKRK